ncbi:MAG: citrate/2-methylcitrate synthase [Myxococcota bacterium]
MKALVHGLEGTVLTETRLSMVDSQQGKFVLGGFPVETLAPRAHYEEALFLLWHGHLPTASALSELRAELAEAASLPGETIDLLRAAAERKLPPMDALSMGLATVGLHHRNTNVVRLVEADTAANRQRALKVVAAVPAIIGAYHRLRANLPPVPPDPKLGHAANYLYMLGGEIPSATHVSALDAYLNVAIDHGVNDSTFAARVIASTCTDVVSAVLGALGALKDPQRSKIPGPGLEMVTALEMVFALVAQAERQDRPLAEVTEAHVRHAVRSDSRLMGFGHRAYRSRDPRAEVLSQVLQRLFPSEGDNPLVDAARVIEWVVLRVLAELEPHRPLATNVEFYTALLLHSLGLPTAAFTPTFAVARVGGWTAHVLEQVQEDRLIRPRSTYVGVIDRAWVPMGERSSTIACHHSLKDR